MGGKGRALVALLALDILGAGGLAAQRRPWERGQDWTSRDEWNEPRGFGGAAFVVGNATGEFQRYVGAAYGGELFGRVRLDPQGWMSLRGDLGFLVYGHERIRVCSAVSCRVQFDLTTTNSILFGGVGPEFALPGQVLRPYVYGTLGFGYFNTTSSLGGSHDSGDFASTVNFDDAVFQSRVGAGVQVKLSGGRTPVYLDFATEYHANGDASYLREGDIEDHPDGSVTLYPRRSEANLVTFRFGVSIGIRSERERPRRR